MNVVIILIGLFVLIKLFSDLGSGVIWWWFSFLMKYFMGCLRSGVFINDVVFV